jgi:hypothetical protein
MKWDICEVEAHACVDRSMGEDHTFRGCIYILKTVSINRKALRLGSLEVSCGVLVLLGLK